MSYSEADTKAKLITPKLKDSGWDECNITREYYFTDGRKQAGGARGEKKFVDYLLHYQGINLAIVEAKKEGINYKQGLQQAIDYAKALNVDYVYSTNGHNILEYHISTGQSQDIDDFPTPRELFERKYPNINKVRQNVVTQEFFSDGTKTLRYYQKIAVQKTIDAISSGQDRILLTLATGTGKTYIAFQIAYRLLEARWRKNDIGNKKPRILYLADRNILIDQAINEFNPIENDCKRIQGKLIKKNGGKVPLSSNVFFAIYQAVAENKNRQYLATDSEDDSLTAYYKQYPADFFDLIIIDECHRGSANDDSSWRDIIEYFSSAVHLGLTATPKRDVNGVTYDYFGEPIYEYSLKDGINDGFLTPYKVKRITTNIDEYRPNTHDSVDGDLPNKVYSISDWEKTITSQQRHELIANTILDNINKMDKTIVFCKNQPHALELKLAIDRFKKVKNPDYCVRVTSEEGQIGRDYLEHFQDNDKDIPVILTSSKMLTTGVDAKNVRNIVLTAPIESMIEFKQIIGRGTRTFEGKDFFTILDFVKASDKFYDKDWDGVADVVTHVKADGKPKEDAKEIKEVDPIENLKDKDDEPKKYEPINITIKGRKLKELDIETSYVGVDGRPIATQEYLEQLIGVLGKYCQNNEQALKDAWANPKHRQTLLDKLEEMLSFGQNIENIKAIFKAKDSDIYDVLNHLVFSKDIITREQRAVAAESSEFIQQLQNAKAREFLLFVLDKYKKDGVVELELKKLPSLVELSGLGTMSEIKDCFGGVTQMQENYLQLQREIYR
ncbi:EcoAI/FtnUII family type I restriction enzme subunit R [Francisella sp. TX07-6608]|uniref:EcoAI/FtnUII family type I restriction enzme subunit R n=1 Tax=Francisella sp. TX07-6608 TaxID=573568 RepID=UPI0008F9DB7C|nr:type I restriction endonuclease subunit R [Francisella sp. TX07-6608]OIN83725.1 DEAD/DEAH box helicase family protein [Francisella sp. TX07-6608]